MAISSSYCRNNSCLEIIAGERFEFSDNKVFRDIYDSLLDEVEHIVMDFKMTKHIDSSALGMLLVMKDKVESQVNHIDIINVNSGVKQIFDLTNFGQLFNINPS